MSTNKEGVCSGDETNTNEEKKWPCEYCTYENWPASKRCTLCHALRPTQLITDSVNEGQDIYKMAALVHSNNSDFGGEEGSCTGADVSALRDRTASNVSTNVTGSLNKWSCQLCTFLNWPRSARCIQCLSPRHKADPTQQSSCAQPLNVRSMTDTGVESEDKKVISNLNYSTKSETTQSSNNDINRSVISCDRSTSSTKLSSHASKWSCKVCTYENWPRSAKCTLCGTTRGHSLSDSVNYSSLKPPVLSPVSVSSISKTDFNDDAASQSRSSSASQNRDSIGKNNVGASGATGAGYSIEDCRLKVLKSRLHEKDWLWLSACHGVVDGDPNAIEAYIVSGGSPSRQLTTDEVLILSRPSAFEVGHTLVHLALRFCREDMLAVLLAATDAAAKSVKRLPCQASPDLASDIRRHIGSSLRQRRGDFPCFFFSDCVTFALPADIEDLPRHTQECLMDELLDQGVQNELEAEESIINWSAELVQLGSRLHALWNRTAGDCLLDSILQVTWGVFDADNTLRQSLADSLTEGAMIFYPRWKEYESKQAETLHFSLDEYQWQRDWAVVLSLASQPGASLEQTHIFALAHILRRPVIVYGVKYVKSFRGETLGLAKFQGVYLPFLWERSFCWKTPVALGYTRGHFSALVAMETDFDEGEGAGANTESSDEEQLVYLPLIDSEGTLLDVHFLSGSEVGREEVILREWMECFETKGGLLVAVQRRGRQPVAVKQMVDEWLDQYRQSGSTQTNQRTIPTSTDDFSSDNESDQE